MRNYQRVGSVLAVLASLTGASFAQVPDLLNAYDAGGRSLGMGGALHGTDPSSMSAYYNPATLGYITKGEVDLALHHLGNSSTVVTGSRTNPTYNTQGHSGSIAVTDFGVAMPVKPLFGKGKASVALSYNIGGYVHDVASAPSPGLSDGSLTLQNYSLLRTVRTDFLTLAYGQTNSSKTLAFGLGLIYAQNQVGYNESASAVDSSGNNVAFDGSSINYNSSGVGLIVGGQYIPSSNPNLSFGLSYRTPISLGTDGYSGIYDRVPARLLADAAYRIDGFSKHGGGDYAIVGAQYQYFFDGDTSVAFDRSSQSVFGVGVEYNKVFDGFKVPIRIGYESASSGGLAFAYRQAFTYGIGFRPGDGRYSIDLNWTTADTGGKDFGISAGYRFGK